MSNQSIDDLMMQLMSMGFEFPDCQEAVQTGHMSVESAVEWLLAGKPQASVAGTSGGPRLNLTKQQQGSSSENAEGTSNPFVSPIKLKLDVSSSEAESSSQSDPSDKKSGDQIGQSEDSVTSRMHLSDDQLKVKQNFEAKQREEARMSAMKEKQRRKRDHERILKEIAEDRERKKLTTTTQTGAMETKPEKAETSSDKAAQSGSPPEKKHNQENCSIQLRMLDGKVVRKTYPATSNFHVVMEDVILYNKTRDEPVQLIQPFPHREFGDSDCTSSLLELGLAPSASLMVKKGQPKQAVSDKTAGAEVQHSTASDIAATGPPPGGGLGHSSGGSGHGAEALPPLPVAPPAVPVNQYSPQNWGPGHRMDEEQADGIVEGDVDNDLHVGAEEEVEHEVGLIPGMGGPLPGMGGLMAGMGGPMAAAGHAFPHFQQQGDEGAFGGIGLRLVPEGHPHADSSHRNRPAAQVVAEKARERFSGPQPQVPHQVAPQQTTLTFNVNALSQLCMHNVASRLTHHDPRHPLLSLSGVSEDLAQKILTYLLKEKLLKPKTLNAFIPCCLRKLVLDCYPYTTNELLNTVRYHNRLQGLSLQSCSLITDTGVQHLSALKRLKHLNLSCCRQITDKSLPTIAELQSLTSLNLEDTGVTEPGVVKFLSQCSTCLQHLNLNRTAVTHNILKHLKRLPELKSLSLEQTQVCGLSGLEELSALQSLDVSHTDIVTDSLLCLPPTLTCLSISHTEKVNGDAALSYLKKMKLQALNLPSRHSTTDVGLQYITAMPLVTLDLTNYINIGNEGMKHIGQIKTLKKLLLSNTKITDEGCLYLEELHNLEVLYLDRTDVGDEGAVIIKGFTALQELSLSSTRITDRFLEESTLCPCYYLSKLNLSRTGVSNKGVSCLKSDSLSLLNLDGTYVTSAVESELRENCPNLKNVTMLNLRLASHDGD